MNKYQLVLLLRSDLKKDAKDKLFEDVQKWVEGGKFEKMDTLGEKKLAYPIKKQLRGEYVVVNFEANALDGDLNRRLLIRDEILRHLLVRN